MIFDTSKVKAFPMKLAYHLDKVFTELDEEGWIYQAVERNGEYFIDVYSRDGTYVGTI